MATTYTHANFSVVDENHDVNVIYPQNTGIDVSIDRSQNATIPNDVSNAQQLANRLAATAFASNIDDNDISTDATLSSNKIDSGLNQLSSDLRGGYNGTMKDLAANSGGGGATIDDTITSNDSTWSSNKINSVITAEINTYNSDFRDGYNMSMYDIHNVINNNINNLPYTDLGTPRCIMDICPSGRTSSDYGYTLDILHEILSSGNWYDYIKDGDYINLVTKNGDIFEMEFNIDPYYDPNADGTGSTIATHHIDMISKELMPMYDTGYGTAVFEWCIRHRKITTGAKGQQNPYLSSNESDCVKAKLSGYYDDNIPDVLKKYIIKKQLIVPYAYAADGSDRASANGSGLEELPELWIPFSMEIFGTSPYSSSESNMHQYSTLNTDAKRIKQNDINGISASYWWTASQYSNEDYWAAVNNSSPNKYIGHLVDSADNISTPLCFRFV